MQIGIGRIKMRNDKMRLGGHDLNRVKDRRQIHPGCGDQAVYVSHIPHKGIGLGQKHAQPIGKQKHFPHHQREGNNMDRDRRFGNQQHDGESNQGKAEIHDL